MTAPLTCDDCGATTSRNGEPFTAQGLASHRHTHKSRICRTCGVPKPLNTIKQHSDRCAQDPPQSIDPWWRAFPAAGWLQAIEETLGFTEELPSQNAALVIAGSDEPLYRGKGGALRQAAVAMRFDRPVVIVPAVLLGDLWQGVGAKRFRRVESDPHDDEVGPVSPGASFLAAL